MQKYRGAGPVAQDRTKRQCSEEFTTVVWLIKMEEVVEVRRFTYLLVTDSSDVSFCQGAQGKRKEVDGENTATAAGVRKRGDAVSYSLLAEVSWAPY